MKQPAQSTFPFEDGTPEEETHMNYYYRIITKRPAPKHEIVTLNKTICDELLAMNPSNRPMRPKTVERYRRDLEAGLWQLTGQGLSVSHDGVLRDGQHRLDAYRQAGYPKGVVIGIMSGLDPDSQRVVDQHAKRSTADMFRLLFDTEVAHSIPAVVNVISRCESNTRNEVRGILEDFNIGTGSQRTLTPDEQLELFMTFRDEIEAIGAAIKQKSFFPAPCIAAAAVMLFRRTRYRIVPVAERLDAAATTSAIVAWLDRVALGEGLMRDEPAFHLRNFLLTPNKKRGRSEQEERYDKTVKALDFALCGKKMDVLKV